MTAPRSMKRGTLLTRLLGQKERDQRERIKELEQALNGMLEVYEHHDDWCGHFSEAPGWPFQKRVRRAMEALDV